MQLAANLPDTGSLYEVARRREVQAAFVPIETQEIEQSPEDRLGRTHELVVIDGVNVVTEAGVPVQHQAFMLLVVMCNISQIGCVAQRASELLEKN